MTVQLPVSRFSTEVTIASLATPKWVFILPSLYCQIFLDKQSLKTSFEGTLLSHKHPYAHVASKS